jgi:hypothetical protein
MSDVTGTSVAPSAGEVSSTFGGALSPAAAFSVAAAVAAAVAATAFSVADSVALVPK